MRWRQAEAEAAELSPRQFDTVRLSSAASSHAGLAEVPAARCPPPHRRRRRCCRPGTHRTCCRSAIRRLPRRRSAAAGCWREEADVRGDRARDAADIEADSHKTPRINSGKQTVKIVYRNMSQLWWLQRNGRRRVGHNEQTDLSRFWVKFHGK